MAEGDFTTSAFARHLAEKRLMASRCKACGKLSLPCRHVCPRCHGAAMEWRQMSGRGKLVAFTAISVAPSALAAEGYGREKPYLVGIVELEEGPRVSARILGVDARSPQNIPPDLPVALDLSELDPERPAPVFRPA